MSVRIHQLSKEIRMENKQLIKLLNSRGYEIKSASSTIDNISAEAIRKEFKATNSVKVSFDDKTVVTPENLEKASMEKVENVKSEKEETVAAHKKPEHPNTVGPTPVNQPESPQIVESRVDNVTEKHVPDDDTIKSEGLKKLHIKPPIVVRDFAGELGLKPFKLISELMEIGIFASMNQTIDENVATELASRHGFDLTIHHRGEQSGLNKPKIEKPDDDDPKFLKPRPPVVCILGDRKSVV